MLTVLALSSVAVASAAFAAQPDPGVGVPPGNQNADVTVCHVPPGSDVPSSILTIPDNALGGHLGHGDFVIDATHPCPATPPPPVDACPDDLNPGIQPAGTVCITPPPPVDACPDDLNPGIQPAGTTCITAPASVDACTDETLNPGIQAAGTTCVVADATTTPDTTPDATPDSTPDATPDTTPDTNVAGAEDSPTTAGTDAAVAGATSLPFTGFDAWQVAAMGAVLLLAGLGLHASASRKTRSGVRT